MHQLRFPMRQMLATVAVVGGMLAIYIPTARMRIDWNKPEPSDVVITVWMLLAETVVFYYVALLTWTLTPRQQKTPRKAVVSWMLILLPGLPVIAYAVILELMDKIAKR